nr:WIAG-tail domain [Paenibacillus lemnae]
MIDNFAVYSIHVSNEAITSTKIAPEAVQPVHLGFNPVQGLPGGSVHQQFGKHPFSFSDKECNKEVTVNLSVPYKGTDYVLISSCSKSEFQACTVLQEENQAVIRISRLPESRESEGWLSWIAVGISG